MPRTKGFSLDSSGFRSADASTRQAGAFEFEGRAALGQGIARGLNTITQKKEAEKDRQEREGVRQQNRIEGQRDFDARQNALNFQQTMMLADSEVKGLESLNDQLEEAKAGIAVFGPDDPRSQELTANAQNIQAQITTKQQTIQELRGRAQSFALSQVKSMVDCSGGT